MTNPYQSNPYPSEGDKEPSEPQFGQRSDQWVPADQAPPSAQSPWPIYQGGGQQPPTTSAPQYGQNQYGQDPYGQAPYGQNQYGQNPSGQNPYAQSAPGGAPVGATPYMTPGTGPSGPLPGRAGPIATLVGGAITMVIIAPIVFVMVLIGNVFGDGTLGDLSAFTAQNGSVVTVDETGVILVTPVTGQADSCVIIEESTGTEITLVSELGGDDDFVARNLTPGQYVVQCEGIPDGAALVVMGGDLVSTAASSGITAFLWATAIGLLGLALTIFGIVWLVRRNKQRREMMAGYRF